MAKPIPPEIIRSNIEHLNQMKQALLGQTKVADAQRNAQLQSAQAQLDFQLHQLDVGLKNSERLIKEQQAAQQQGAGAKPQPKKQPDAVAAHGIREHPTSTNASGEVQQPTGQFDDIVNRINGQKVIEDLKNRVSGQAEAPPFKVSQQLVEGGEVLPMGGGITVGFPTQKRVTSVDPNVLTPGDVLRAKVQQQESALNRQATFVRWGLTEDIDAQTAVDAWRAMESGDPAAIARAMSGSKTLSVRLREEEMETSRAQRGMFNQRAELYRIQAEKEGVLLDYVERALGDAGGSAWGPPGYGFGGGPSVTPSGGVSLGGGGGGGGLTYGQLTNAAKEAFDKDGKPDPGGFPVFEEGWFRTTGEFIFMDEGGALSRWFNVSGNRAFIPGSQLVSMFKIANGWASSPGMSRKDAQEALASLPIFEFVAGPEGHPGNIAITRDETGLHHRQANRMDWRIATELQAIQQGGGKPQELEARDQALERNGDVARAELNQEPLPSAQEAGLAARELVEELPNMLMESNSMAGLAARRVVRRGREPLDVWISRIRQFVAGLSNSEIPVAEQQAITRWTEARIAEIERFGAAQTEAAQEATASGITDLRRRREASGERFRAQLEGRRQQTGG